MFKDEVKRKLDIKSEIMPFTLTMLSRSKLIISGVKNVLLSSETQLRFRLTSGIATVSGEGLQIVEIGGGDAYVKGYIGGVLFE
ncbi:MAG: YabP/YqfC family sporulation protein [Clostridia bacterium]|nr:YabP/YqfC family sporulation protein [Clostridia bacterium]